MRDRLRIIVAGLLGRTPLGGWHYVHYLVGLARLGHDVYYHEDTWSWPYHPILKTATSDGTYSAQHIQNLLQAFGPEVKDKWHYLHLHKTSYGMTASAFRQVAESADLFINVGGASLIPDDLSPHCVKVFIDTDPGYNQIVLSERPTWSENVDQWSKLVHAHDIHITYAENIEGSDCLIPHVGLRWKTSRPPVVPDLWDSVAAISASETSAWTTIATWNAFQGKLEYEGIEYKSKDSQFALVMDLPSQVTVPLKVAMGGQRAPFKRFTRRGWQVVDGPEATLTPQRYRNFIRHSRGEITTAKHVYVAMRSGWFSERSTCYLASGRPVITQDTGFSQFIPAQYGLLGFSNGDEAASAIRQVESDYQRHSMGAREIANDFFDSAKILSELIEVTGRGDASKASSNNRDDSRSTIRTVPTKRPT